ncbi:MAG: hypothetical protein J0L75_11395 [Spirochaetes bacterium]|nr:hypothetical protein [Spirochaetota bacterium]
MKRAMRTLGRVSLSVLCLSVFLHRSATPAGRAAFDVLHIGFGGAASGLGGSGVAAVGTLEGVFANPASLASQPAGIAVLGSYNPYLDMGLWSAAASVTKDKRGSLAIAAYGLSYGAMNGDIAWNGDPGRLLKSGDLILSVSGGLPLGGLLELPFTLDFGLTGRVASQALDESSLTGLLFDAGMLAGFRTGVGVLSVGLQGRNFGAVLGAGNGVALPTSLASGLAWRMNLARVLSLKVLADGAYETSEAAWRGSVGAEAGFFSLAFLRGGYSFAQAGGQASGLTLGMGVRLKVSTVQVRVDYAFIHLGDLGGSQHSVQLGFAIEAPPAVPAP